MKYTLTTYKDGEKLSQWPCSEFYYALKTAADVLLGATDEYEITNESGHVVAYAMTEDSPKAIQAASEMAISHKEMRGDSMREIAAEEQARELQERQAQRGIRT